MSMHAVAVASDIDDMAGVKEPIDQGRGHDLVSQHLSPVLEALVGGEHGGSAQGLEPVGELAGSLGLFQGGDEVDECAVVDPASSLGSSDGEMGFPDPWRSEEDHVLPALEKAELMQGVDLLPLDGWLEREVEVFEGLYDREPGGAHCGMETPIVAQDDLGPQEPVRRPHWP